MQIKWLGLLQIAQNIDGSLEAGIVREDVQIGLRDDGVLVWKNTDFTGVPEVTNYKDERVQIGSDNTKIEDNPYNIVVMIPIPEPKIKS